MSAEAAEGAQRNHLTAKAAMNVPQLDPTGDLHLAKPNYQYQKRQKELEKKKKQEEKRKRKLEKTESDAAADGTTPPLESETPPT